MPRPSQGSSVSAVFKRKRDKAAQSEEAQGDQIDPGGKVGDWAQALAGETAGSAAEPVKAEPGADRSGGPWDVSEAPDDGIHRLDFGALHVPGVDGMNVNLEVDEQTQQVVAITVVLGEGGIQLQPFAAPRSGNFWPEVRGELTRGITESGGIVDEAEGPFGLELRASVPAVDEQGQQGMQQVRFVGIEGPRWLLRGVLLGVAALDERSAEVFEDVFRGCIVVRGNQPMAPGDMLGLQIPAGAIADEDEEEQGELAGDDQHSRAPLDPFERGPEITEIR